jgi:hypothetical protein
MVASPPQFLNSIFHNAGRSPTVPSATGPCVHDRRILNRKLRETALVFRHRILGKLPFTRRGSGMFFALLARSQR